MDHSPSLTMLRLCFKQATGATELLKYSHKVVRQVSCKMCKDLTAVDMAHVPVQLLCYDSNHCQSGEPIMSLSADSTGDWQRENAQSAVANMTSSSCQWHQLNRPTWHVLRRVH